MGIFKDGCIAFVQGHEIKVSGASGLFHVHISLFIDGALQDKQKILVGSRILNGSFADGNGTHNVKVVVNQSTTFNTTYRLFVDNQEVVFDQMH